jgi:NHL repeat
VIPTAHIAKPAAAASKTGRFALLRGLLTGKGSGMSKISFSQAGPDSLTAERPAKSGRPEENSGSCAAVSVRRSGQTFQPGARLKCCVPALLCALVGAFAFIAVAQAEPPRLVSYGNFASDAGLGVAVDQSSGDVFAAGLFDLSNGEGGRIEKFSASGEVLSPSPFGEGFHSGAAVNPVNRDLYVLNATSNEIETYDPSTGAPVGTPFSVPGSENLAAFATVVQIAADSAGNVYVPVVPENEVLEYSPTGTLLHTFTGSGAGALNAPTGVAVDASGDVWVADTGNNRIEELSPADLPLGEINDAQGVASVALDGHGDVFAILDNTDDFCGSVAPPCAHLVEYSAAGVRIADVGAGSFDSGADSLLAVNEDSTRVYVTDFFENRVWMFAPPAPPTVVKELTAEVGSSEAKLGALVNPGGLQTTYRFEYGTSTAYGQIAPSPEGSAGEGITSNAVWAAASGLAPGTTYHYRVVATNELGPPVVGPDQTFTTEPAEQAACPNQALRSGFSAKLPDCRAYELVTPPNKGSVVFDSGVNVTNSVVAGDGNALSLFTGESFPGAPSGGLNYVATRGAAGWSLEDIVPLEGYTGALCTEHNNRVLAYSNRISKDLLSFNEDTSASETEGNKEACNAEGLELVPGEPVGYENLLLRGNATGAYQLVNAPPPGVTPADAHFEGASADLSHVVFSERAALTPEAPSPEVGGLEDLYEWDEGALRLLTVLPGGAAASGSLAEVLAGSHAISEDGSTILFTSGGALYARLDGERTVQVDESRGGAGASGGRIPAGVSADGSRVLFLDESRLTEGSTAASGEPDLYECVLPEHATHCELSDLSVAKAGEHADVLRVSPLAAHDSSHVYFVAEGVLATNTREYTDSEGHTVREGAAPGQHNLYLWNGETTTFIATLSENDFGKGVPSPDGTWFAFDSVKSLTGYDNSGANPAAEIFLYSAASNQLVCASCNPSGEAPIGDGASLAESARRPLSDGGRLFFETTEALVPSDTNGQLDVYEYANGGLSLISSGTSEGESLFLGASESGDDVFINSAQQLVPQDTQPGMQAVYDVRVGGGIPASSLPAPCTTADGCRSPVLPQPSIYGAPASATFSGVGNVAPPLPTVVKKVTKKTVKCKQGLVKNKQGKCVRKKSKKKAKRATNDRRGK